MRKRNGIAARLLSAAMVTTMVVTATPLSGLGITTLGGTTVLAATGDETKTVTLGDNLLKNGDFSSGSEGWGMNQNSSQFSFADGAAVLKVTEGGLGADWMPGLFQDGFTLDTGKNYQVSFDIVSTINRSMTVGFDTGRKFMQDVTLTANESQHMTYQTGVIADGQGGANQKLYFYLGKLHDEGNYEDEHTITIDNVSVQEVITPGGSESGSTGGNGDNNPETGGGTSNPGSGTTTPGSGGSTETPAEKPEEQHPDSIVNGAVYTSKDSMTTTTKDEKEAESSWSLSWSDEFGVDEFTGNKLTGHNSDGSGSTVESAAWTYMIGDGSGYSGSGWGNAEKEVYTDTNTSVVTGADIDGAALKITAQKQTNGTYSSARLWTMDDGNLTKDKEALYKKQYGRVEARIRVQTTDGEDATGLWPAFWMMPADDEYGTWAASGELDIMEARGRNVHSVDGTIHYGSQWPNNKASGDSYTSNNFYLTDWHTYAVEWLPGEIRWYVDDICYSTLNDWYAASPDGAGNYTYPAPFNQEFYILLNLAVGGNYDGGALSENLNEASMLVDYVRVYDLQKADKTVYSQADYEVIEETLTAPKKEADANLVSGEVGVSYVDDEDIANYKATGNYPSEVADVRNNQWYVSNLASGTGKSSNTLTQEGSEHALTVNVTNVGSNDYEVQLIHNVPLTQGYTYEVSFDAKADSVKSIAAKFGNISGYPAYSDSYSVDLTADWKHFTYSFDMTAATDPDGRLEFTLGGTAGNTSFKNFSICSTGKTREAGADDDKTPLGNGNHVYNGTFDLGTGRTYFWNTTEASLTSAKADCVATVTGTTASSGIFQKGMNLLKGDSYHVSLDAWKQSGETGTITVSLTNADGNEIYGSAEMTLTDKETKQAFDFVMKEAFTDTSAVLRITTGTGVTYIDNVVMKRTSNNNLAWNQVDLYPLYNGDFYNGDDGWNIWSENAGWQQHSVTAGMDMEYSVGANADFWCVGVQSPAVSMTAGVPYAITLDYTMTTDGSIKFETPDGVQTDYDFEQGAHEKTIFFTPSKDVNGNLALYFGNQGSNGNQHFILKSMSVVVDEDTTKIPDDYKQKKPGSVASAGIIKAGENAVIKTNDTTWAGKIEKLSVNGTEYDATKVLTVSESKLTLDSSILPEEGTYSIKFQATGYADTKAITQKVLAASGNVLINGEFTTDVSGWVTYFSSWNVPNGTAVSVNGEADIHIVSSEGNNWDAQLKQEGLTLEQSNYYMLSFDAYASVARPIQMEFANLGIPSQTIVNLTNEKKTYYIYFSNVNATKVASILFMMGNVEGCLADFAAVGAHDIYIDNVNLHKSDKAEVDEVIAPELIQKEIAVAGKDVVLTYTENQVWEKKELTVVLDGKTVDASYVKRDAEQNTITLSRKLFTVGEHHIVLMETGYDAIEFDMNVIQSMQSSILKDDWGIWKDDADEGSIEAVSDSISCHFVKTVVSQWTTPEFWSLQAKKEGIVTGADKAYELSFDADLEYEDELVTANRGIMIETSLGQQIIAIQPGMKNYTISYTPGERKDFYVQFMLGGVEEDFSTAAHNIVLSNIKLVEKGNEEEPELTPVAVPEITSKTEIKKDEQKISIEWNAVNGAESYGIYQAGSEDGVYALIGETKDTFFEINIAELESMKKAKAVVTTEYYFAVKAFAEAGKGDSELQKLTLQVETEEAEKPSEEKPSDNQKPSDGGNNSNGNSNNSNSNNNNNNSNNNGNKNQGNVNSANKGNQSNSGNHESNGNNGNQNNSGNQNNGAAGGNKNKKSNQAATVVAAVDVAEEKDETIDESVKADTPEDKTTNIAEEETPKADTAESNTAGENTFAQKTTSNTILWIVLAIVAVLGFGSALAYGLFRRKK